MYLCIPKCVMCAHVCIRIYIFTYMHKYIYIYFKGEWLKVTIHYKKTQFIKLNISI